jgi:hypothetical protein
VISTPNFAALFYGLTHNMNLSMGLACSMITLCIIFAMFYFGKKAKLSRSETSLLVLLGLLVSPNLNILELLYLFAGYYAVHIVVLFFTLGIYAEGINNERIKWIPAVVSVFLAFCLGVQGVRGILVLYAPLFGIEIIRHIYRICCRQKFQWNMISVSIWVCILPVASFIGTFLSPMKRQGFSRNIRNGFTKLFTVVIPDMGKAIGFHKTNILGKLFLCVMLCMILYLLIDILLCMWKKKPLLPCQWTFLVITASPVLTALIIAFTTIDDSERYYFLLVYTMAFAVVLTGQKLSKKCKIIGGILVAVFAAINIYTVYIPILRCEEPPATDLYKVGKYLEEHDILTAYSTFENANTLTVLTNGKVRAAAVDSLSKMNMLVWMSSTDWYVPNVSFTEKTAYVIPESEMESFSDFLENHQGDVSFETQIDDYLIYTSDYNFSVLQ